jgi:hypothetical protein
MSSIHPAELSAVEAAQLATDNTTEYSPEFPTNCSTITAAF